MIKCYVICDYLSEENRQDIMEVSSRYGYDTVFYETREEASGRIADAEVAYCVDSRLLTEMPCLKWCHDGFAGVEKFIASGVFDTGEAILTNSSGAYGRTISEHIIMVTLMLMRQMPEYRGIIDRREWVQDIPVRSIAGSRISVIGTGDIGRSAARRYKALGAESVTGFSRSGRPAEGFDRVYRIDDFDSIAAGSSGAGDAQSFRPDVLLLCVPGTGESAGILSGKRIAMLAPETFVINVGRGTAIDQDALTEALNEGRIAGAALDVVYPEPLPADHPLWTARNCIITPHISGDMGLPYTVDKTVEFFCRNLEHYAKGEPLINQVDIHAGY